MELMTFENFVWISYHKDAKTRKLTRVFSRAVMLKRHESFPPH